MMIGGYQVAGRVLATIIGCIVLAVAIMLLVHSCDKRRSAADQAKVDQSQAQAAHDSAADAINAVTEVGDNAAASEDLTRKNAEEIRNAQGANDPVNPAARDAGLRSLCRRPAYHDNPKCRVFVSPAR